MTYKYLSDIKSFLEENVSTKIQLRGIVSGDDLSFEMVNPKITVGWPTTYDTPADVADKIPGLVVGLSAPIVYTQDSAVIPVELVAIQRLEQIPRCPYIVGFNGKFRGVSQKNDNEVVIEAPNLPGNVHAVEYRHKDVQQQNICRFLLKILDQVISVIKNRDFRPLLVTCRPGFHRGCGSFQTDRIIITNHNSHCRSPFIYI